MSPTDRSPRPATRHTPGSSTNPYRWPDPPPPHSNPPTTHLPHPPPQTSPPPPSTVYPPTDGPGSPDTDETHNWRSDTGWPQIANTPATHHHTDLPRYSGMHRTSLPSRHPSGHAATLFPPA